MNAEEKALPEGWLAVKALDLEAQGVAHRPDGKVVFIDGALPFEVVSAQIHRSKTSFEKGTLTEIHQESAQRVRPDDSTSGNQVVFGLPDGATTVQLSRDGTVTTTSSGNGETSKLNLPLRLTARKSFVRDSP